MGISQATTAAMVFLTGLLPSSCHKTSAAPPPNQPNRAAAAVSATNAAGIKILKHNLGEILLTNKCDLFVQFANGNLCTLTPKMIDQKSVRITLALESKNEYGETSDFAVKQVVANPGKSLDVAVGNLNLTFTPQIVSDK